MAVLPLYGDPSKGTIINVMREELAMAGYDFAATPEEDETALRRLTLLMAELYEEGLNLGFNFNENSFGTMGEGSGLSLGVTQCISLLLAKSVAATQGKTLRPESLSRLAKSEASMRAKYMNIPNMTLGRNTLRGAGNRRWWWYGSYYPNYGPDTANEVVADVVVS